MLYPLLTSYYTKFSSLHPICVSVSETILFQIWAPFPTTSAPPWRIPPEPVYAFRQTVIATALMDAPNRGTL